ncbi:dolichyl-diphosphooligosaccharide--protein glycosyltransferase subunit STT3B-like isoform X2 [Amphibalanus amphitrite]|uniref:dolichyl-diphosphooligosaccharide--protein glycosyltransferase subunit STT3B-like n=1 Tax=Amphibalanus amphitrite TaxID=1232801 RepID=UPI001C9145ED|nr:dolichyl-diphosphooligosaccharide--protein glycosyltransferase subunit STT3B-like [Amphibalanus amphitrite]XP_043233552.1 dolichyl-diphosphooligosaccharide--protein glycosyltransferase subunit STT3B-like isoform X2 [Amphibalanus amphitrite]
MAKKAGASVKTALNTPSGVSTLLTFAILALACVAGFSSRLFAVIRFESIIHEFDPWFNYRSTAYMVKHGFYNFLNWFDERAWYPLGRIVGGTVYPGLMLTSGLIHHVLDLLNIPVHIRDICVFLAPIFSGLTAIATFLLTRELWSTGAGLFAACFIAIVPGYISRSVAGSYDNEGIAIFALMFTYFLWVRSVKTGSVYWASLTALSYFYMVSAWGGYVFIINLIPLHVFALMLMGRYSTRLYTAYTTFFILGLLCSMQIPFVGFQPIRTSEHMASAGVFALINAFALLKYLQPFVSRAQLRHFFLVAAAGSAALVFLAVVGLTYAGVIAPWSGRFYSLWDTGYAKIHIPIIASVSEHQPTTWFSFFFDLHILVLTYPVGLWYCIKNINDERVFIVLYAVSAVYFAGVMVRLMLTLTPVVCVLSAIAFSQFFSLYLREERDGSSGDSDDDDPANGNKQLYDKAGKLRKMRHERQSAESDGLGMNVRTLSLVAVIMMLMMFAVHCTWVTSNAYSSPSIVLASYSGGERNILDDFREGYYWLWQNTPEDARVMSWWDYGYQIAGMANRTTLVDNNTWNNSHIALVGKAMSSNESAAYEIMTALDVDYVLVIFGGVIGYSGDDINKFLWMVRIAEGEHPQDIKESDFFTERGEFRVDSGGSRTLLNCLMYKLSYYRFGEMKTDYRVPAGYDRTRNAEIGNKNIALTYLEEAYTTEHWLVRIYRVKKPDEFNRPSIPKRERRIKRGKVTLSKKTAKRRRGSLKDQPVVVKGRKPAARA